MKLQLIFSPGYKVNYMTYTKALYMFESTGRVIILPFVYRQLGFKYMGTL